MSVEPLPDERAALVDADGTRLLVIADYHAGIESVLRTEGVELDSQARARRARVIELLAETSAQRLVVLGDLVHAIGEPWESEREELIRLFDALTVPVTLVKGNHDGALEPFLDELHHDVAITDGSGIRIGSVGFVHGHTWPSTDVLEAEEICMGHEHPVVRLEDSVGGRRHEHVWLRGEIAATAFEHRVDETTDIHGELIVFPAFNELSGGTWVNVDGQEFLSPFLPEALDAGQAYLLDGTRLGPFRDV